MKPYEKLLAWQACRRLNLAIATATDRWPRTERFELTSQVRRAAWSAPANLVEGSARRGPREFSRFLDIALGSLAEVGYGLRFARDRGILSNADFEELENLREDASRLTWLLMRSLRRASTPS